jgi:hypothetical protein
MAYAALQHVQWGEECSLTLVVGITGSKIGAQIGIVFDILNSVWQEISVWHTQ